MSAIQSIRYIAGFGRICSFSGEDYLKEAGTDVFESIRAGALQHMNEDHVENMKEIGRAFNGLEAEHVEMAALERTGCLFRSKAPEGYTYNSFAKVVNDPKAFKSEIIALLQRARAKTQASTSS